MKKPHRWRNLDDSVYGLQQRVAGRGLTGFGKDGYNADGAEEELVVADLKIDHAVLQHLGL